MEKDARSHDVFKIKAKSHGLISCVAVVCFQKGGAHCYHTPTSCPPSVASEVIESKLENDYGSPPPTKVVRHPSCFFRQPELH